MRNIKRIVFVCTGNTCRSPMAAALAKDEIKRRGLGVKLGSAGIDAVPGNRATPEAVAVCAEIGLDISGHAAQQLAEDDVESDTLYVAMARQHLSWLRYVLMIPVEQLYLLGDGVPDPYGCGIEAYRDALDAIARELEILFERIGCILPTASDAQVEHALSYVIEPIADDTVSDASMLENRCFPDPWSLAMLTEEMDNPDAAFMVAVGDESAEGGKKRAVYGYGGIIVAADVALMPKLCVAQNMRRRGIAAALINALAEEALSRGATELTLEVRVSNKPAISLYEKLGFESMGVRPNFYSTPREDALIMTKQLIADEADEAARNAETAETAAFADEAAYYNEDYNEEPAAAAAAAEAPGLIDELAAEFPDDISDEMPDASEEEPSDEADANDGFDEEYAEDEAGYADEAEPQYDDIPEEYPASEESYDEDDGGMMIIFPDADEFDDDIDDGIAEPEYEPAEADDAPDDGFDDDPENAPSDDEDDGGIIFIFPEDE